MKYANEIKLNVSDAPSLVYADGYAYMDGEGTIDFSGISNNHADQLKDFLFLMVDTKDVLLCSIVQ